MKPATPLAGVAVGCVPSRRRFDEAAKASESAGVLLLAMALTLISAADAGDNVPRTAKAVVAAERTRSAKRKRSARSKQRRLDRALTKFAVDDRPALRERLGAASLLNTERKKTPRQVEALLMRARLQGVQNAERARKKTLRNAQAIAKKRKRRSLAKKIGTALEDDILYLRFASRRKRALSPKEADDTAALAASISRYVKLGDRARALRVALVLADRKAHASELDDRAKAALYDLTALAPKTRDAALDRARAFRTRARFLDRAGEMKHAAHAHLAADHEEKRPAKVAAFSTATVVRSRATSAFCRRALAANVDCTALEKSRFGARAYYSFADDRRGVLDEDAVAWALAEYQSLIHVCLDAAAQRREVAGTVEIEWAVSNRGRVRTFELRPRRLRGGPLSVCLDDAFKKFRYPRYVGEMQHIALAFEVNG